MFLQPLHLLPYLLDLGRPSFYVHDPFLCTMGGHMGGQVHASLSMAEIGLGAIRRGDVQVVHSDQ